MKLQSVKSSPGRLRWLRPWTHEIGMKGSLATTRPSKLKIDNIYIARIYRWIPCVVWKRQLLKYWEMKKRKLVASLLPPPIPTPKRRHSETDMLLKVLRRAVKANPMANIDFILNIDRSRFVAFSRSSSLSIFRFEFRSVSATWSLRFSTKIATYFAFIPLIENDAHLN